MRVPYRLLLGSFRKIAIEALFPDDRATAEGWEHRVTALTGKPESLWKIAEWFTGDGTKYREIRKEDGIASLETREGQVVRIPARLLTRRFARRWPPLPPPRRPRSSTAEDAQGRYAIYRLQKGEALYSAVVVRFTGRVHAEDVNAKANGDRRAQRDLRRPRDPGRVRDQDPDVRISRRSFARRATRSASRRRIRGSRPRSSPTRSRARTSPA